MAAALEMPGRRSTVSRDGRDVRPTGRPLSVSPSLLRDGPLAVRGRFREDRTQQFPGAGLLKDPEDPPMTVCESHALWVCVSSQNDSWNFRGDFFRCDTEFSPTHPRHPHVGEEEIEVVFAKKSNSLISARTHDHLVLDPEHPLKNSKHPRVVVYTEKARPRRRCNFGLNAGHFVSSLSLWVADSSAVAP